MYLSELFLEQLSEKFYPESVMSALKVCNEEFQKKKKQELGRELLDFWDVYVEFDAVLSEQKKAAFEILDAARQNAARWDFYRKNVMSF